MSRRGAQRPDGDAQAEARRARLIEAGTTDHYLDTELYDFEYGDRVDDIRFYRDIAARLGAGRHILELGAGTGRITLPLVADGHRVVALDAMPAMLASLRTADLDADARARLEIVEADMRAIPRSEAEFDAVFAPFNALMHLYTWRDLLTCFSEVARVLRPGGTFAFDVQLPDLEWLRWDPEARHAVTRFVHPRTGDKLIYSTNHDYDPETQICHIRIYYDDAPAPGRKFVPPPRPRRLVHLAHRQIFPEELRMLVALSGLELFSLTGDFLDKPLRRAKESQVAICVKPR